jgi:hypothetical protein
VVVDVGIFKIVRQSRAMNQKSNLDQLTRSKLKCDWELRATRLGCELRGDRVQDETEGTIFDNHRLLPALLMSAESARKTANGTMPDVPTIALTNR